jgi:hypothetical protein
MANTYSILEKSTLTTTQTNVEFTGLGSYATSFNDLILLVSVRSDNSGDNGMYLQFNGSSANLSTLRYYTNGSAVAAYTGSDIIFYQNRQTSTANTFGNIQIYIPDFSASKYKTIAGDNIGENMGSTADMALVSGLWSNTNAITSIKLLTSTGSFVAGSSFYLYGVKNN